MTKKAYKLLVHGKVQGVGYRWFVKEIAEEEKLFGYVKNNHDGTVEIVVEAENEDKIKKFIERIKQEHPYAIVKKVDVLEISVNNYENFDIVF